MNKRVDLLIEVKSFSEEQRYIRGIATTPTVDRMGDIVDPLGAKFEREIPLLLDHDTTQRVGRVRLGTPTKNGIPFEAWIPKVLEEGILRDRVDMAWQEVKYGLLKTVSIGFSILNNAVKKIATGFHFLETEILELSLVPVPAQSDAKIQQFKSLATKSTFSHAAPGTAKGHSPARAGATQSKGNTMKTYTQEALAGLQSTRETKAKRMEELRELKQAENRKFNDDERGEFDGLDSEIEDLDDEIRVTQRHIVNIKAAKPVNGGHAPYGFVKKLTDVEERFKGETGLKRAVATLVAQKEVKAGNMVTPAKIAEERWGKTNPTLVAIMKAAVAGGGTDSGEWGAELAQADTRYTGEFLEYLYALTCFDRLPLRSVPHNVVIKGQDGAFTGYFTGQSKSIKVSKGDFSSTTTVPYKAAGLTVVSNELLRDSSPAALDLCGRGLRRAVAQIVDSTFFSTTAVVAGVSPAGIFNGLAPIVSNGGDAQSIITDVGNLWAPFITANLLEGTFVWVMGPATAVKLSLMRNALGQTEFPSVTPMGGTFQGYPIFITQNMHAGDVAFINADEVWKIGDLGVSLSVSDSAMIEQDSAPQGATDTPVAASATMTSMFQEDSTAIRVIRPISWGKARAAAVAFVGSTTWGAEAS